MNNIKKIYNKIYKGYIKNNILHISFNIALFSLFMFLTIFSVYAIKKNPINEIKIYYILISILTGLVTFISSIISLLKT